MAENDQKEAHVPLPAGGLRFDEGKSRVDLIPADAMLELGRVYEAGDRKYRPLGGPRNWEKGMPWTKVLGPLMRHLFHWMMGETRDPEDGQRHIAKVAWNAIALLTYELRKIGEDDRGVHRIERAAMTELHPPAMGRPASPPPAQPQPESR